MEIKKAIELLTLEVDENSLQYKITKLLAEENPIEKIKPELKKRGAKEVIISVLDIIGIKIETYLIPTNERVLEILTEEEIKEFNNVKRNIKEEMLETKRINEELKKQIKEYKE